MKKTWIIILSTILAIVVVLQIAVMVFLNSTGIHIISKYARFNTGGKGYVYNTVTKEWEGENISWYIDLLVRNKKADGVLSVEDYGKLTGNRPVISVDTGYLIFLTCGNILYLNVLRTIISAAI